MTTNTCATAPPICSWPSSRSAVGVRWRSPTSAGVRTGRALCGTSGTGATGPADKLVLVMDQLNTHSPASLYEAFAPAEAKRLADRLEIHHTPKHGSWLNMAEIELSALDRDPGLRRGRLSAGSGRRQGDAGAPRPRLAASAQRCRYQGRLAVHDQGRPHQAPQTLPDNGGLTEH